MTLKEISIFLKQAREAKGYSFYKMRSLTGLHYDSIKAIESGIEGYNEEYRRRVADIQPIIDRYNSETGIHANGI